MKDPGWDPYGWREGDTYYCISGGLPAGDVSGTFHMGHRASLYRCSTDDLSEWELVGDLLANEMPDVEADEDISCPNLLTMGDKRILLCMSHKRGTRYYVGRFESEQFHPEHHFRMNWPGGVCCSPEAFVDDRGRQLFWAWAVGSPSSMTLPRVLSLDEDTVMRIEPAEELDALRLGHRKLDGITVAPGADVQLDAVNGDCMEMRVTIDRHGALERGIKVRCSLGGREETVITYHAQRKTLGIDFAKSAVRNTRPPYLFADGEDVTAQEAPLVLRSGEVLDLRIYLDRSMLEVFANGRQCLTQRIYPTLDDSVGVRMLASATT